MGLGIYITSEIPQKGLFKKCQKNSEIFYALSNEFKKQLPEMIQSHVFASNLLEDKLSLQIHPAEEPVEFEVKDNMLTCSAKTNSAGPGYHAFLVETLKTVGEKLGVDWQWSDSENDIGDETGYHENRDFSALQDEMLKWLQTLAKHIVQQEEMKNIMISLSLGYSILSKYFAASPLGFWDKGWFETVVELEIKKLKDRGKVFFPWWEKGFGAEFWYKCGLTKAWVDLPWHVYANEEEKRDFQFVLECFQKAKALNDKIELPEEEIKEIKKYLDKGSNRSMPKNDGIGFRKRSMMRKLTGSWTIKIPGYYYEGLEENGEAAVYWFGDRTIRGSSITMEGKDGKPATAENLLRDKPKDIDSDFEEGHLRGWAKIERTKQEGENYWVLHGEAAMVNNVCVVTICFDKDIDRDWALETWRSVYMPEPKME